MTVKSPRLAAFEALYKIQQESAYSNLSLDHLPVANGQERAFATALVRGVLERQITLDALVDKFTTGRLKPKVRVLLRMGAYQALYMDKVPVPGTGKDGGPRLLRPYDQCGTAADRSGSGFAGYAHAPLFRAAAPAGYVAKDLWSGCYGGVPALYQRSCAIIFGAQFFICDARSIAGDVGK